MAEIINTNIAALDAQRNLAQTQKDANVAFQRLSSGLRINSAKDDAAGLAISTRFEAQIKGLTVAQRNANDGISLAQTTEGALGEVTDNLQRIRELAVQAANATNSSSDRAALDAEVQQRIQEIDRVSTQTNFNGLRVLDGSFGKETFQVGADAGQTISLDLSGSTRADAIGQKATVSGTSLVGTLGTDLKLGSASFTAGAGGGSSSQFTMDFSDGQGDNLTISAKGSPISGAQIASAFKAAGFGSGGTHSVDGYSLSLGSGISTIASAVNGGKLEVYRSDGNTVKYSQSTSGSAYTAGPYFGASAGATITQSATSLHLNSDGFTLAVGGNSAVSVTGSFDTVQGLADAINAKVGGVLASVGPDGQTIELTSSTNITVAGNNSAFVGTGGIFASGSFQTKGSLENVSVNSISGANDAIQRVDNALTTVNGIRSELGAIQNRFQSTISNLSTETVNLSAANSRIKDADFAKETAELSRTQVLQQAGISVLAQANQRPQQVLQLLR